MRALLLLTLFALAAPAALAAKESFPGLPEDAMHGICNAHANNEQGRERGRAGEAPPFRWLGDEAEAADMTVEEYCAQFPRPGRG